MTYIERYSFVKHLENEQQAAEVIDNPIIDAKEQEITPEIKASKRISVSDVFKGLINKLKKYLSRKK